MPPDFESQARELIDAGRFLHGQGWVPATSGNFSARLSDGSLAITVSGRNKGHLQLQDIMRVDAEGRSLDGRKPSAETLLHTALYQRFPKVGAVLHPHSPGATLISRIRADRVLLENYELLKALDDIHTHETPVVIPIFQNDQNIPRLARKVDEYMDHQSDVQAYIIASHGLYTWGATVRDTLRKIEALEFLFNLETRLSGAIAP